MKFSLKNIFKSKKAKLDVTDYEKNHDDSSNNDEYRRQSVYWTNENIPTKIDSEIVKLIYQNHLLETDLEKFLSSNRQDKYIDCLNHYDIYENLSFPGPFYTGESDTCGTGISEASENVIFSHEAQEFIMIQLSCTEIG
jgi:hypothetical protein